jgi:hypothetical protein
MDTKAFPSSTVCFHHTRKIRSLLAWVYLYVCALEKPRERFHDAPYYSGFAFARIDHTLMRLRGLCVYESKGPLLCVQKKRVMLRVWGQHTSKRKWIWARNICCCKDVQDACLVMHHGFNNIRSLRWNNRIERPIWLTLYTCVGRLKRVFFFYIYKLSLVMCYWIGLASRRRMRRIQQFRTVTLCIRKRIE